MNAKGIHQTSRLAILGAAALGALSAGAQATTLYVDNYGQNEIQSFSGVYGGSVVSATSANNFVAQNSGIGVTVDGGGNVVVDSYTSGGGNTSAAYSASGAFLGSSAPYGSGNYASAVVYNNSVFVPSDSAGNSTVSQLGYTVSGGSATFGPITTLIGSSDSTLNAATVMLMPAGIGKNTTSNSYLVYASWTNIPADFNAGTDFVNAFNLSNSNAIALSTDSNVTSTGNSQIQVLAFDRNTGDIYADEGNALYQIVPQFSGGTLSGFSTTSLATTTGSGGGLNVPVGLAFGPDGNLYVAELGTNEIDEVNIDGNGTGTEGQLNEYIDLGSGAEPFGIAFSAVPEPTSLTLLTLGAAPLLRRRRR